MNRGIVKTSSIADKLKEAKKDIIKIEDDVSPSGDQPKVFVNGRLNRKENLYIPKNFSILDGIAKDLSLVCKGVDLAIINYLIHEGLQSVKKKGLLGVVEYSDIEKLYSEKEKNISN